MKEYSKKDAVKNGVNGVPIYPRLQVKILNFHEEHTVRTQADIYTYVPYTRDGIEYATLVKQSWCSDKPGLSVEELEKLMTNLKTEVDLVRAKYKPSDITGLDVILN